ncbi:MAG: hypothetical protein M3Q15_00725 [Pseudomonadota bacterium]|nr:hypothetical protein [Pseudomonadota bacterium]
MIWAAAALGIAFMLCFAGLKAWRGWLDLRRHEIASVRAAAQPGDDGLGAVIEIADMRERLRKLEAIATGVDL